MKNRLLRVGLVVLVVLVARGAFAQGPFSAQITAFWRFLMTAPQTVSGLWTFTNLTGGAALR